MKKLLLSTVAALAFVSIAHAQVVDPGHVLGNGTSSARTATDSTIGAVMQQAPATSGLGTGVGAAAVTAVNTTNGFGTIGTSGAKAPLMNAANTWSALQTFSSGISTPQLPGLSTSVQSSGYPGLDGGKWFVYNQVTSSAGAPLHITRSDRFDNYSGGSGVVYNSWNACTDAAGVTNFIFCGLDTLDNVATSSATNMVARYMQAFKEVGAGPTFAGTAEVRSYGADPTTGAVGMEVDVWGKDGDGSGNGQRVALDLVGGPIPGVTLHNPTIGRMLRIGAQNGVAANATILRGISFQPATWTSLITTEGVVNAVNGIDFTGATFSGSALKLTNFTVSNAGDMTMFGIASFGNSSSLSVGIAGKLSIAAGTTSFAPLTISQGVAPTTPGNGDIWMTSTGLFYRFNSTTHGPL